jgi:hypothetical protein
MKYFLKISFTLLIAFSCIKKEKPKKTIVADAPFEMGRSTGKLDYQDINEASGLVASRNNPDALWTHNDSGDKPRIFLISDKGKHLATFNIQGAKNRDWEDITSSNENGINYLYVGDIGDNDAVTDIKTVYRFPEPKVGSDTSLKEGSVTEVQGIRFRYPDGKRDAECLMIDPTTKDMIIISKREENVHIYLATYPQSFTEIITLTKVGTLPFGHIVAGDISPDGKEILLKNYEQIFYWKKKADETIIELLKKPFQNLSYTQETQGEAIAWKSDGKDFFTVSENPLKVLRFAAAIDLLYYQRK